MTEHPHPIADAARPTGDREVRMRVLSVLVEDGPNTLSKVSGLIRRKGFHVRSISIGPSRQAGRSRMTLTVDAGHAETDQVRKQLERVVEVIEVEDVTSEDVHSRELVVAKVKAAQVSRLVQRGAKVLNTTDDGTTVEFAGDGKDVGDFINDLMQHGVVDVARSGPVVMRRSA
ncbi:MAG: acetolactate synthase small subunit [Candidatus Dormibacteraeota bacterium]|nr:acetolactate synthase small subunit [Candidatus Dormibacteraeota bacterium]